MWRGARKSLKVRHRRALPSISGVDGHRCCSTEIKNGTGFADAEVKPLDQADFASVRAFTDDLEAEGRPIDILVANIGVSLQKYHATNDGWEETCVNPYSPHSVFLIASQPTSEPPLHRPSNNPTVTSPDSGRQGRVSASNHHRRKLDALLGESIKARSRWCRNSEILERQSQSEIWSVGVPQLLR